VETHTYGTCPPYVTVTVTVTRLLTVMANGKSENPDGSVDSGTNAILAPAFRVFAYVSGNQRTSSPPPLGLRYRYGTGTVRCRVVRLHRTKLSSIHTEYLIGDSTVRTRIMRKHTTTMAIKALVLLLTIAQEVTSSPLHECELFVADSTIPNSGSGIFSAVDKKPGDTIGDGDLAFPILFINRPAKAGLYGKDPEEVLREQKIVQSRRIFDDYTWNGLEMGMAHESLQWEVSAVWPGLFCATNSMIPLRNIDVAFPTHSSHGHDLPYMPHRSTDPGAGSVTTYRAAPVTVSRTIPAGGEVFVMYGDYWFTEPERNFGENLPLTGSFVAANALLKKFAALELLVYYNAVLDVREVWKSSSRVLNALPENDEDLKLALGKSIEDIYQKNATRSLEWLREHGTCVDHTLHKPSTIAGSGEGAFAKRRLPKGTVITGSPLLTIEDNGYLDLGGLYDHNDGNYASYLKQILYNYCFGHEESSLLFIPYAAPGALFINHGSGQKANVGLQWANPGKLRHDPLSFELSPDQLVSKKSPQIGIEYVALQDIDEGDELFLDYGEQWEEAWDEHVESWRPVKDATIAADWNREMDEPVRTKKEQKANPYPASIVVRCHSDLLTQYKSTWAENEWNRKAGPQMLRSRVYGKPCEILKRSPNNATYTVSFKTEDGELILDDVPRKALFFLDAPQQSDLFLENAFRFPIQLPDGMVPDAWRNRKQNPAAGAGHDEL
jgi:hypothetical protein